MACQPFRFLFPITPTLTSFKLLFAYIFSFLYRTVCSPRTSLTQLFMWPGLVLLESMAAQTVANAGTLLSTARNVQVPCLLTVLCTWVVQAKLLILTASAILRGTVSASTKARCAWDSGLVIALALPLETPTQVGIQCPGSSSKRSQKLKLRSWEIHLLKTCFFVT